MSIYDLAYKIELYGGAYKIKHGHNERWRQKALRRAPLGDSGTGRLAQRESTVFTRRGSLVQTQQRPPFFEGLGGFYKTLVWSGVQYACGSRRLRGWDVLGSSCWRQA